MVVQEQVIPASFDQFRDDYGDVAFGTFFLQIQCVRHNGFDYKAERRLKDD